jgi:cystathionine gamma-synthase
MTTPPGEDTQTLDGLRHVPVGHPIPGSVHSVSVSVPSVADVVGFESGDEDTLRRITWGYPRFRVHRYVREVAGLVGRAVGTAGRDPVLTRSARAAAAAAAYAGLPPEAVVEAHGVAGVMVSGDTVRDRRVRAFVQHTGCHLSSREAEEILLDAGLIGARQPEASRQDAPEQMIAARLAQAYGAPDGGAVSLHNSGMNALTAAIAGLSEIQRERGRRRWLQLGWIFFDTMSLFAKQIIDVEPRTLSDPFDVDNLARIAAENADDLAGIVAEIPSNPLLQTPDLDALREIADRVGCAVVVDATIATPHNVDVLGRADVVCESLTKYATGSADVLMGAAVVNPASLFAAELQERLRRHGEAPFHRDAARVAARIRDYEARMRRVNSNTIALAEALQREEVVRRVHWAYEGRSEHNYRRVERAPDSPGGVLLLDMRVPLEQVYDRLAVPKGPSFGADFTMASPQIFIAYFDMLRTAAGRKILRERGLHRDMLRVSVGTEDVDRIVATFQEAFRRP